jgi:hypothetical protein
MRLLELYENSCKAKAYDASLKNIERMIREIEDSDDKEELAGLKLARTIMKAQLRFLRYTKIK